MRMCSCPVNSTPRLGPTLSHLVRLAPLPIARAPRRFAPVASLSGQRLRTLTTSCFSFHPTTSSSTCQQQSSSSVPNRTRTNYASSTRPLDLGGFAEPYGNRDQGPHGRKTRSSPHEDDHDHDHDHDYDPDHDDYHHHYHRHITLPSISQSLQADSIIPPPGIKHEERCVLVGGLPWSILPHEVQAIAGPGLIDAVESVEVLYNAMGGVTGKAMVTLTSISQAAEFARQADRCNLSGRTITTQVFSLEQGKEIVLPSDPTTSNVRKHNSMATTSLFASFLVSRFGGKVVALSGVPLNFTVRRLANLLWHGDWSLQRNMAQNEWNLVLTNLFYRMRRPKGQARNGPMTEAMIRNSRDSGSRSRGVPLEPPRDPKQGVLDAGRLDPIFAFIPPGPRLSSRMHLIVFETESEAHRFVRRWHRQPFNPQEFGWQHLLSARIMY